MEIKLANKEYDNLILKMKENNNIESLLAIKIQEDRFIVDTKNLESLKEKYRDEISYNDISAIFAKLNEIFEDLKNYMIYEEDIYLGLDYIFIDEKSNLFLIANIDKKEIFTLKSLLNEIICACRIKIDDNIGKIIGANNFLYAGEGDLNELCEKYFKKHSKNTNNNVIIKKDTEIKSDYKTDVKKNSVLESFTSLFKKKPYKVKSLNIDFKLPEKNQKNI